MKLKFCCFWRIKNATPAREITQFRGISRSLVSKSVDLLMKKGYLEAKQDEKDRRVIHLLLLPKAEKTIEKLNIIRREFMSKLCEGITREEADAFMVIVRKMAGNVQKNIPD